MSVTTPLAARRAQEHLRIGLDTRTVEHAGDARDVTRPLALGMRANPGKRDRVRLGEANLATCLSTRRHRPPLAILASSYPSVRSANMCSQPTRVRTCVRNGIPGLRPREGACAPSRAAPSIVEIAERLALPKTTVFYWVRDIPLRRPRRDNAHAGGRAMMRKYRLLREKAYKDGREIFDELSSSDPTFRDFVCMYIGEGYKRNRNAVRSANSDPRVMVLATRWLRALSRNKLHFSVQYHADQELQQLSTFWASTLSIDPSEIRVLRKSNSGRLGGRTWRCQYGVLTVTTCDTLLRARLQAWMDCVQETWLHSPDSGA